MMRMFRTSEYSHTAEIAVVLYMKIKCGDRYSGIVQCSWEDFRHVLSNELSKWLKFHSRTRKTEFVGFGISYASEDENANY